MDELLRYYEEELGLFGQFAREFRARYPKPASELHVAGETWEDPGVARLIQSVALLSARIQKRLDDDYPKFTEALLDSLYPHYLRPLPSYSIVRIGWRGEDEVPERVALLPRGTMLRAGSEPAPGAGQPCRFRTVYDVLLAPLRVCALRFVPLPAPPRGVRLPRAVTSAIALALDAPDGRPLDAILPARLRLFADGDASVRAALVDALLLRCRAAWIEADGDGRWLPLARVPLRLAGFDDEDALLPHPARSHPALRLLTEYFSYPEKFNFLDLDLDAVRALLPPRCRRVTLHLGLAGIDADADGARLLAGAGARNLLVGCTPVVNLFPKAAAPVQLAHTSADVPLVADGAHAAAYEIHSVDAVRVAREDGGVTAFRPLYVAGQQEPPAHEHGPQAQRAHYWIARRDHAVAAVSPGHELRIVLLDADFRTTVPAGGTLSADLTCSNRDAPAQLHWGQPQGDLRTDEAAGLAPVRLLRKPTPARRFDGTRGAHWRLVAHLSLHHAGLSMAGLAEFRKMLALYDLARSPVAQRQIAGIAGLEHGAVRAWMPTAPVSTLMPGIGIRLTVDEDAFAGSGLAAFVQVLDHYVALNGQLNCFTRLQVVSQQTGREIAACAPRTSSGDPLGAGAGWT
ncbi:type VI secretion system baseplate subunit TssF [uncultured Massilia sp.]|uniref:type VI secretion system baseplate subunit TssF n=1 Tax=uncultured Massilia sp. TaxID=169973 RepID=UPI0025DF76AB|nr:type VI secretion system baseplate subunit TssF [uncultured Massilia sp.]